MNGTSPQRTDRNPDPRDPAVDAVIRVFQPRVQERISRDRAVAMHASLFGFVNELLSWKREDDEKARAARGAR